MLPVPTTRSGGIASTCCRIGRLSHLAHLDISHNAVRALPPALAHCRALTNLRASHNMLSGAVAAPSPAASARSLPLELGGLTGLTTLVLSNNPLGQMPPLLDCLCNLQVMPLVTGQG